MKLHLWLIALVGVIVPRRLRADWRQEWEAELRYREAMLAEWTKLDWRNKFDLLRRSLGAFRDALLLQPRRLEDEMFQDLHFGVRMLLKSKGFTAVAVLSLAIGIGANTAIFTLIDALMLRMLPVKEPQQLALFSIKDLRGGRYSFNHPLFMRFCENSRSFTGIIAAAGGAPMLVSEPGAGGQSESVRPERVSGNYFSALGVNAALGRALTEDDNNIANPQPVAVISHDFWQRRFGLDPAVVGKKITLNNFPLTIVGVAPPGFHGIEVGRRPEMWWPLSLTPQISPGNQSLTNSGAWWLRVMGRLQPGVSLAQAREELNVIFKQQTSDMIAQQPQMPESDRRSIQAMRIELEQGGVGHTHLRQQFKQPLLILMTIVALTLLIACANVANLLLARSATRRKEIAVRLALGAGRWRLIRQLLTESVMLSLLGGALGLLFASWGTRALLNYLPQRLPIFIDINPDWRALGFTLAVSLLIGILFGLAPALRATRLDLTSSLKEKAGAEPGRLRFPLNKVLVVAQVALSLFLLIGAGLFVRTLQNLRNFDTGFDRENLTQFWIDGGSGAGNARHAPMFSQLLARLETLPGARSASVSSLSLLVGDRSRNLVKVPGYTSGSQEEMACHELTVGPRFFETMGMTMLAGRGFGPQDERPVTTETAKPASDKAEKSAAPPLQFAVINQTMARAFFGNENPVGKSFSYLDPRYKGQTFEIIGVVNSAKYDNLRDQAPKTFYKFYAQQPGPASGNRAFQIRALGDPVEMAASIKRVVREFDPTMQIFDLRTMNDIADEAMTQERFVAELAGFFSLFALLLSCIGLYGVMSYAVTRRTNEIGIRMALGARGADVVRMVMKETMLMVVIGAAIGLSAALATTRLVSSLLFGLAPNDPMTIAVAAALMIAVAALAGYLPARRASRVDPMTALRCE